MDIRLNPQIDWKNLKETFARDRRLHIPNIFEKETAERIHQCLRDEIAWNLTYCDEDGPKNVWAREQVKMTPKDWQMLRQKIMGRARDKKFQFFYSNFAIEEPHKAGLINDLILARVYEFVNSEPFLKIMRDITGFSTITHADQQATAYGPGHFLTEHNDFDAQQGRKVAYVFNFTPEWKAEWGGLLQFIDPQSQTLHGLIPAFNALNLFAVPARHCVTQVATYSPATRYSLTGWLIERSGQ